MKFPPNSPSPRSTTAITPQHESSLYFGKILSRGDFVKSATGSRIIGLIDEWVAKGMELVIANPGWKNIYDNAGAVDFLFVGTHKRHAITGTLASSRDASSRRFPFIAATTFAIEDTLGFIPVSALLLERPAARRQALVKQAVSAQDANAILDALAEVPAHADPAHICITQYHSFLARTSVGALESALLCGPGGATLRQMVLAIGFLMQPILVNGPIPPKKALSFPLPGNPAWHAPVKALWLSLVCLFLQRAEFELSVFATTHFGRHRLVVAFNGTTATGFHALFDEQAANDHFIDIYESAWVEEVMHTTSGTPKLASYLQHRDLTLQQLMTTFAQVYSG